MPRRCAASEDRCASLLHCRDSVSTLESPEAAAPGFLASWLLAPGFRVRPPSFCLVRRGPTRAPIGSGKATRGDIVRVPNTAPYLVTRNVLACLAAWRCAARNVELFHATPLERSSSDFRMCALATGQKVDARGASRAWRAPCSWSQDNAGHRAGLSKLQSLVWVGPERVNVGEFRREHQGGFHE
jgi:hypothetical protein